MQFGSCTRIPYLHILEINANYFKVRKYILASKRDVQITG